MYFLSISFSTLLFSIGGAIIAGLVGSIWYANFAFGKVWRKEQGLTLEKMKAPEYQSRLKNAMWKMPFVYLVLTYLLMSLLHSLVVVSIWHGIWTGLVVWVLAGLSTICLEKMYKPQISKKFFAITVGHHLVTWALLSVYAVFAIQIIYHV